MSGQPNFLSYADVLRRHQELSQAGREVSASDLHDFAAAAAAAGARIAATRERSLVQNILYYWAAEQITRGGKTEVGWSPPALEAFNAAAVAKAAPPATGEAAAAAEPPAPAPALADSDVEGLARTRAIIRIAATARQWRVKDHEPGYLLTGRALAEASLYVEDDPDIAELVRASGRAASRDKWKFWSALAVISVLAVSLLAYGWFRERQVSAALKEKSGKLEKSVEAAEFAAEKAKSDGKLIQEKTELALKRSREQQGQMDDTRAQADGVLSRLEDAVTSLRAARSKGLIASEDIPPSLRWLVEGDAMLAPPADPLPPPPVPPPVPSLAAGYDPAFLIPAADPGAAPQPGDAPAPIAPLSFPKLGPKIAGQAFGGGKLLDYVNFSIVLSAPRRMPLATASNFDRGQAALLARPKADFQFDARVPQDSQAEPAWFTDNDIDRGHLVTAREIAWGAAFKGDPAAAGQRAYALVNTFTNITPQFDTFNKGVWRKLEHYAESEFNPGVSRVTIFSGPVLADDDPMISGVKVPRQFWKILVSTAPDRPSDLVVEAYLIAQVNEAGTAKLNEARFVKESFRARVSDVERLTGLDFGENLRAADRLWRVLPVSVQKRDRTPGDDLAERAKLIDDSNKQVRKSTAQEIITALRDDGLAASEQLKVAAALIALAQPAQFQKLSADGRFNLAFITSEVPKAKWDLADWIDLKAATRRAAADIEAAIIADPQHPMPKTLEQLQVLKQRLDWPLANGVTVYLQFAGMTREDANAVMDRLKLLGWTLPGAERVGAAATRNEVRFTLGDAPAAQLLAADLRALGRTSVQPRQTSGIKPGVPEIWISN